MRSYFLKYLYSHVSKSMGAGLLAALLLSFAVGCGGTKPQTPAASTSTPPATSASSATPAPTTTPTSTPSPSTTPAPAPHGPVIVVAEENHGYSSVIGNSAMPYLNSLAQQYGLATQFYANFHPSIGNYFMITTGQMVTVDDTYTATVPVDNLVRHLVAAGKTWKSYAESLPSSGGPVYPNSGAYLERHNPFTYFSDVRNSSTQQQNVVDFSQFKADLNAGTLPDFSFVVPNSSDDAHNGTAGTADAWLQQNIGPVLSSTQFQNGGLLIVWFDEAETTDTTHGGGHVAVVMAGPNVKTGFQSTTLYQHQDLLNTIANYMGIDPNIGGAGTANNMSEFFKP